MTPPPKTVPVPVETAKLVEQLHDLRVRWISIAREQSWGDQLDGDFDLLAEVLMKLAAAPAPSEGVAVAWRGKDAFEDMHGDGVWHHGRYKPEFVDAVKVEPLYTIPPHHTARGDNMKRAKCCENGCVIAEARGHTCACAGECAYLDQEPEMTDDEVDEFDRQLGKD